MRSRVSIACGLSAAIVMSSSLAAADKSKTATDAYDALFAQYLKEARTAPAPNGREAWTWLNGLSLDRRARRVNDLVTIRVIESITASGTADSALSKSSGASNSLLGLFGLEKKLPGFIDPTALAGLKSESQFKGSGATTRAGELTAVLTARVAEVLPNGDLIVEGAREIEINGDRQIVVLSGVARTTDIDPQNMITSTAIGQLRIRYFGRGLMKDNLSPGFLLRILNKVF